MCQSTVGFKGPAGNDTPGFCLSDSFLPARRGRRFYAPALLVQQEEIRPTFTQNERTAKPDEDGRFTARCIYVFPSEGLDPMAKLLLVVRDPDERQVARFTVDLSAMR